MSNTDSEEKSRDDIYRERNLLALAFIAQTVGFERDVLGNTPKYGWWPDTDDVNGEQWAVVWCETKYGQVGWHVGMNMVPRWLPKADPEYDGYTTDEKNARIAKHIYPNSNPIKPDP